jgi:hypothetical protein
LGKEGGVLAEVQELPWLPESPLPLLIIRETTCVVSADFEAPRKIVFSPGFKGLLSALLVLCWPDGAGEGRPEINQQSQVSL